MPPPNILWIYCDELRDDALGCYGNRHFAPRTPHLDSLAAGGMRFTRSYCPSPVCAASRMAVLTALPPEATATYHNECAWGKFTLDPVPKTFTEVFAEHGYATANFGKIHYPKQLKPWQHCDTTGGDMASIKKLMAAHDPDAIIDIPGVGSTIGGRFPPDTAYPAARVADNTIQFLRAHRGRPFLARASILQPHTPVGAPPPYETMYAGEAFPRTLDTADRTPSAFIRILAEAQAAHRLTPEQIFLTQQYYYGLVSWIDAEVGRMLACLDENGLRDNTLVVFTADHGAQLGEAGLYAKLTFEPASHRVPLILAGPGVERGTVRDDLASGIDLARTLLGAANLPALESFGGRNLLGDPEPEAVYATIGYGMPGSRAFSNLGAGAYEGGRGWPRRTCVRTRQYRLDANVRMDGEGVGEADRDYFLADTLADPDERHNLAGRPEHAGALKKLAALLDRHVAGAKEVPLEVLTK
ncbi:MAG: hypothetical protein AMXMBFR7_43800 [Planctomycetota bacterium]